MDIFNLKKRIKLTEIIDDFKKRFLVSIIIDNFAAL